MPQNTKYIFVCGGVMSGIGKGITTASLGRIIEDYGYKVALMKIDQYFNVDAGTMNPVEHGEVFVTDDGLESDQDLGNYERFLNVDMFRENYMTSGMVYKTVIDRERNLGYDGKCVEAIPHIPEEIIRRIKVLEKKTKADFIIIEVGGTVGEYQNLVYLEAARMMKMDNPRSVLFVLVSFLPILKSVGEMKSKPTQYAARTLNAAGIQPDIIIARSQEPIDEVRKRKISTFCNVSLEAVISAPDVASIYEVPVNFERDNIGKIILDKVGLTAKKKNGRKWISFLKKIKNASKPVKIGVVGKYFVSGSFSLTDSYISVIEAIKHAAWQLNRTPEITWLNAEKYERNPKSLKELSDFDGIIIPGGFGSRGIEGKLRTVQYVRENNIPFLGLCYGLQMAVIEFARNVCGLKDAHTTEINSQTNHPVVTTMTEQRERIASRDMGGTMRLGAFQCKLARGSQVRSLYKADLISERHRHRYEVNNDYRPVLQKGGLSLSGINPQRDLVEVIEITSHPFFIASQFHPELKSRPLNPHPLFLGLIKSAIKKA